MSSSANVDFEECFRELWPAASAEGQTYRRVFHSDDVDIVALVNDRNALREVRFEFNNQKSPMAIPDEARGLRVGYKEGPAKRQTVTIGQIEPSDSELFATLAKDLAASLGTASGQQAIAFSARLAKWQRFFSNARMGLTKRQQLGLVGELTILRSRIGPAVLISRAVDAWHGPSSAVHDFSQAGWAIEVKATAALGGRSIRVSNELQMDPAALSPLFLAFLIFDVRPFSRGMTLPRLVEEIRKDLQAETKSMHLFNDRLFDVGYLDLHRDRYTSHYLLSSDEFFEVKKAFPALRADELPLGVSHTKYQIDAGAIQPWRVPWDRISTSIKTEETDES